MKIFYGSRKNDHLLHISVRLQDLSTISANRKTSGDEISGDRPRMAGDAKKDVLTRICVGNIETDNAAVDGFWYPPSLTMRPGKQEGVSLCRLSSFCMTPRILIIYCGRTDIQPDRD